MRELLYSVCLGLVFSGPVLAEEINWQRAHYNYQMNCQGCHTPDGSGFKTVPQIKGHVGNFLTTEAGRQYLVRVPGSATSALDDNELAEVLNWILEEFAGNSLRESYRPYTAQEVGELRQEPLNEVYQYRTQLLANIGKKMSAPK